MYIIYFLYLKYLAQKKKINGDFIPIIKKIIKIESVFFVIFFSLAFYLSREVFEIILYALLILIFFPLFLYVIVKTKNTIEST